MTTALTLPMAAERLIPHLPPMRLVDALASYDGKGGGVIEACPGKDCILADATGALDEVALVELIAQGYAAMKGYEDLIGGKPVQEGFLVGVRKLRLSGMAYAGDLLRVEIGTVGSFEGFAVVEGTVVRGSEVLAAGTIKLWIVREEA